MASLEKRVVLRASEYIPKKLSGPGTTQIVKYTGVDGQHSEEITCKNVKIIPSKPNPGKCSPNVNLKSRVDYTWEHRFFTGRLLAVHVGGRYVAYGQNNGIVRVVNRVTNERGLVKGMEGVIHDLSFAHMAHQVLLGVIDERGTLFVHLIEEDVTTALTCRLVFHVPHDIKAEPEYNHRITWVPILGVGDREEGNHAKLLAITLGSKAELWHIKEVIEKYGGGPHKPEDMDEGLLIIEDHQMTIVDAAFSPEGSALATASLDGTVKFFQVPNTDSNNRGKIYMHKSVAPRCLHNWRPHDGKPLSSVFFLDNHKLHNPESQFWRFVITGADHNTELKVWRCIDWSCLQTISFAPDPNMKTPDMFLKATMDLAAKHLLLTDVFGQVIYVFRVYIDPEETTAYICSASEFLVPFSILSFGIVDAGFRVYKSSTLGLLQSNTDDDDDDDDDDPEDDDIQDAIAILIYLIQPKSMQECLIRFVPPMSTNNLHLSTIVPDNLVSKEHTEKPMIKAILSGKEVYRFSGNKFLPENPVPKPSTENGAMKAILSGKELYSVSNKKFSQDNPVAKQATEKPMIKAILSGKEVYVGSNKPFLPDNPVPKPPTENAAMKALLSDMEEYSVSNNQFSPDNPVPKAPAENAAIKAILSDMEEYSGPNNNFLPDNPVPKPPTENAAIKAILSGKEVYCIPNNKLSPENPVSKPSTENAAMKALLSDKKAYSVSSNSYETDNMNFMTSEGYSSSSSKAEEDFSTKEDNADELSKQDVYSSFQRDILVSGGSSPSREVQEILSLQHDPPIIQVEDLIRLQRPQMKYFTRGGGVPQMEKQGNEIDQSSDMGSVNSNTKLDNCWPPVPNLKPKEEMANRMRSAGIRAENSSMDTDAGPESNMSKPSQRIEMMLSTILETVQKQESQIKELRQEVASLKSYQSNAVGSICKSMLDKHRSILEKQLDKREAKQMERQEKYMTAISQAAVHKISNKFEEIMSNRIKDIVLPTLLGGLDQMSRQCNHDFAQKLTSVDNLLKDGISKLLNNKPAMDLLSQTLITSIRPSVGQICKELFLDIVIPRCEKALENIFIQVHDTFTKGTKDYILLIQKELEKIRQQMNKSADLLVEHDTLVREAKEKLSLSARQDIETSVQKVLAGMKELTHRKLTEIVKEAVSQAFQAHKHHEERAPSVRSRAVTPAPHVVDKMQVLQTQIMHSVATGQLNAAFQQALSASDLNLVVFLCERLNPESFFRQNPCPLHQPILLSLIQQLSADLTNHTDLKYKYMEEALMNLDMNEPLTKEHAPEVLSNLKSQLNLYLNCHTKTKHSRNIKMLLMMAQSLLSGPK